MTSMYPVFNSKTGIHRHFGCEAGQTSNTRQDFFWTSCTKLHCTKLLLLCLCHVLLVTSLIALTVVLVYFDPCTNQFQCFFLNIICSFLWIAVVADVLLIFSVCVWWKQLGHHNWTKHGKFSMSAEPLALLLPHCLLP